jgi:hypothetical protein
MMRPAIRGEGDIMLAETAIGVATIGGLAAVRNRRMIHYRQLKDRLAAIRHDDVLDLDGLSQEVPRFDARLATIKNFLPVTALRQLTLQAGSLVAPERSYIPAHKRGGTVAYETLIHHAPALVALYHAAVFQNAISRIVGLYLQPTPLHDQSSLSVLFYNKPGDHIGWHYDHNFYRGHHFTVLLPLINEGFADEGLSHARLEARMGGKAVTIKTAPNTLIIFEGAAVHHKVSPIRAGERRLVLSMTYCTDPAASTWQSAARRIKDSAFFGIRALWT